MHKQRTSENKSSESQSSNIRLHSPSQETQSSQRNNYQNHPDIRVQRFYAGLPPLQTKLQVGKSGDKYEQEADRIADKVVSGSDVRTPLSNKISPIVQQSGNASETEVDSSTQKAIRTSYGHGRKLPDDLRKQLEPKFGLAFGDILIHNDRNSHRLNRKLKSQAFTVGKNIYFGENKYKPDTQEGKRLLAHELTHTVQQTGAESIQRNPDPISSPNSDTTSLMEGNSSLDESYATEPNLTEETPTTEAPPEPQFEEKGGGSYTIVKGDSLWKIAKNTYGSGLYWVNIKKANPNKVSKGGDLIFVGDVLELPVINVPKAVEKNTTETVIEEEPNQTNEIETQHNTTATSTKKDSSDGKTDAISPWVDVYINPTENIPEIPIFLVPFLITSYKPIIKAKVKIPKTLYAGTVTSGLEYKATVKQKVTDILSVGADFKFGNLVKGEFKPSISLKGNVKLGDDWDFSISDGSFSPPKVSFSLLRKGKLDFGQLTDDLVNLDIEGDFGFLVSVSLDLPEMQKAANAFLARGAMNFIAALYTAKEFLSKVFNIDLNDLNLNHLKLRDILVGSLSLSAFGLIIAAIISGSLTFVAPIIIVLLIALNMLPKSKNEDDD